MMITENRWNNIGSKDPRGMFRLVIGFKELLQRKKTQREYGIKIGDKSLRIGCLELEFEGGTVISNGRQE